MGSELAIPELLPVLPLKQSVVFPHVMAPLLRQPRSLKLLENIKHDQGQALLVLRKDGDREAAGAEDVHHVGTVGSIQELRRAAEQVLFVVAHGVQRVLIREIVQTEPYLVARLEPWPDREEETTEARVRPPLGAIQASSTPCAASPMHTRTAGMQASVSVLHGRAGAWFRVRDHERHMG